MWAGCTTLLSTASRLDHDKASTGALRCSNSQPLKFGEAARAPEGQSAHKAQVVQLETLQL